MKTILSADEVKKIYGKTDSIRAVDGVSLKLIKGKSLALIGESGSGKTTFGKLAVGLEKVSSGTISFMGKEIQNLKEKEIRRLRRDMQMIFQSSSGVFDPGYTIGESIYEVLKNYVSLSKAEYSEAIEEVLEKVGLDPSFGNSYASQISGGQCQRANIARALVLHPKMVICDEPVSSLDFSIRKQILTLLRDMGQEFGITYLLITHDLSNVPYVCDAVAIMYQGKIVEQIAQTEQIEKTALHPYTKLLFQSIPATDPRERKIGIPKGARPAAVQSDVKGCSFQNRCPYRKEVCKEVQPLLREAATGHNVACHCYHT
ncbi:ABC transporter ATP-binding protein [Ruminococcus sp. OA3]|uniref:oligopeptide/dipeptide ABC transporter ATP-binding protein n=1 Tax=Ruminococcus sp. OA3 TaxID=2914164 RepID=UPI001F061909|nr:ABC transporter ATP-binding protein [Ruminococcus sp. OA3]MCH1983419.1 ABC transporter ATP-binding protein [Ruminococcus sp. OA3]